VTRDQMAAFITRTLDQSLSRGSRRAAMNRRWIPSNPAVLQRIPLREPSHRVQFDGTDIFVTGEREIFKINASAGYLIDGLELGVGGFRGILPLNGTVYFAFRPGGLSYRKSGANSIEGGTQHVTNPLANFLDGIAFDGQRIFIGSQSGQISIVTPTAGSTWPSFNVGGFSQPRNVIFDGTNIWVTEFGNTNLLRINSDGGVLQTVSVGSNPLTPAFDGTNLWIPNYGSATVSVVRAATGAVVATLVGNGLSTPSSAAFDGEHILVTNETVGTVSLFRATDLVALGSVSLGPGAVPVSACSDGIHFWIVDYGNQTLIRF